MIVGYSPFIPALLTVRVGATIGLDVEVNNRLALITIFTIGSRIVFFKVSRVALTKRRTIQTELSGFQVPFLPFHNNVEWKLVITFFTDLWHY